VTSFLRDPEAWDELRQQVIEPLAQRDEQRPIRIWSAGCASGEETYTLIMLLAETMGIERFKRQVKVYATDADTDALNQARQATYSARDLEPVPAEWRERYFEPNAHGTVFRNDLRRCVIFGEHDLVQDAPISRLDLLICRNTLIYFNAETQARILARFHFALNEGGFVFLGKSELLLTHTRLFTPIDARARIFVKVSKSSMRERLLVLAQAGNDDAGQLIAQQGSLRESSFDAGPVAQIVLDNTGAIVLANDQARTLFRLSTLDLGKAIQDLELSYRPVELRARIDEAYERKDVVRQAGIEYRISQKDVRYFDLEVTPLLEGRDAIGVSITFIDVTGLQHLRAELEQTTHNLEAAYEELQATNEELETTNEELQSTIEELETTNEELQATNEELETMNEELQSTNEELETINDELRLRSGELNSVNEFLEAVMTSLRAAVCVTDTDLNVTLWNLKAENLWGLRREEVEGRPFLALDIGLPVEKLARPMRECLDGQDFTTMVLDAVSRRGREIRCSVTLTRLSTINNETRGLILFMEEEVEAEPVPQPEKTVYE
jgi:two-component system CheB/CheR fusion protein